MGNQIWECRAENVLVSLLILVGIWLGFCLRRGLSKPAASAETLKHPVCFQQAPWHFSSSAASRTSAVDLPLDTCLKSSTRLRGRESAKLDAPLQSKAGRWFLCYLSLQMVNMSGKSFQMLQKSNICHYLFPPCFGFVFGLWVFFFFLLFHFYLHTCCHWADQRVAENSSASWNEGGSAWLDTNLCFTFLATCWTLIKFPVF